MKRSTLLVSFGILAVLSSTAFALTRHVEFSVIIVGVSGSNIRGSGLVTPSEKANEARTAVTIKFEKDVAGAERPWHIHHGTCAKPGIIVGGARIYPAIKVDAKGAGNAKLTLPIVLPDTGVFYVSVHESAKNMSKVVACGDMTLED
jgi:superoxide dismutase, Cu-Zn family